MLEAICFKNGKLKILNQLKLPLIEEYEDILSVKDAWNAIHSMKVRGAPAIAIVGVLSIAVEIQNQDIQNSVEKDKNKLLQLIKSFCSYICTARPTAVNIKRETDLLIDFCNELSQNNNIDFDGYIKNVIEYSEKLLQTDVSVNRAIGDHGAQHILANGNNQMVTILTHCNTGSLATAGYGTALGVIRSLNSMGKLAHAYCTETRPYNQGARLTAFELVHDKIPATLICDNMVAALMKQKKIDAVVVGADRVVLNGDTANKIGTYQLAVSAKHHNVPFYVASPKSTIDTNLSHGDEIPIELRPNNEMKFVNGTQIAPLEIDCWNPSFDVTPADLITGIITEFGVFETSQLKEKISN